MRRIKILQVLPTLSRAGTEMFVLNNLRAIDRSRFEFIILALSSKYKELEPDMLDLGASVHYCDIEFASIHKLTKNLFRLAAILKNIEYDVIHCHKSSQCGPIFLASLLSGKKKCIAHSHFSVYDEQTGGYIRRFIYSKIFPLLTIKLSNILCACSETSANALYGSGVNSVIVKNAIDIQKFMEKDEAAIRRLREELSIPEGVKVFANISRYAKVKNLTFVVDVFKEIHKEDPLSVLVLAGKKEETYDEIVEKIISCSLMDSVRLLGQRTDVNVLLHLADCVIFPSLNEGFPYQVIEAQAASTPIVVSDCITHNVDLKMGLVSFVNLNESAHHWAKAAMSTSKLPIEDSLIRATFNKECLDIQSSARQLEEIYEIDMTASARQRE